MADVGYFDSVSANLKTGVGAQVKGISEGVKANSDALDLRAYAGL